MNRQPQAPQVGVMDRQDAERIIVHGDAELLVQRARDLAQNSGATRTAVRQLYGEAKRIEMLWRDRDRAAVAQRRVVLFTPRLAYRASRDPKLREIQRSLEPLLQAVQGDRERFQRFVEFFEAVVAYMRPS